MVPSKVKWTNILRRSLLQVEGVYFGDPDWRRGQAPPKVEESNGEFDTRAKCLSKTWLKWQRGGITQKQMLNMGKCE